MGFFYTLVMPKFDCKDIANQSAIRYTRLAAVSLLLFNFLLVLWPAITDVDEFGFFFVVIALLWGVSSAAPFFIVTLKAGRNNEGSRLASSGRSLCLSLKRGLLVTAIYWTLIYVFYLSGSLEKGMLAGFMMLLSPFIITPIMIFALRTKV